MGRPRKVIEEVKEQVDETSSSEELVDEVASEPVIPNLVALNFQREDLNNLARTVNDLIVYVTR